MSVVAAAFVDSDGTKLLVAVAAALGAAALTMSLAIVFSKRQARIERRLAGYEPVLAPTTSIKASDVDLAPETRMVSSAMEFTRGVADRAGVLAKVELLLEQAHVPFRPAEFLFYVPLFGLGVGVFLALGFGPLTGLIGAVIATAFPFMYISRRKRRRLKKFEEQLPDSLNLLAGSMRAGFAFTQGLEAVAQEAPEPMHRELQRVFTESRLGRPIEEALEDCAIRMASNDLGWVVMALRIQREVGGNLAELLDTVAHTMSQRERLRSEIRSLTAEGRFSAIILSIMPFFFLAAFQVLQPDYVPKLFHNAIGLTLLVMAGIGNVVGWIWLRKIVAIEV